MQQDEGNPRKLPEGLRREFLAHMKRRVFLERLGTGAVSLGLLACNAVPSPSVAPTPAPATGSTAGTQPTAVTSSAARVQPLSPPATVRIIGSEALGEAGVFIAMDKGYFQNLGIQIDYTDINPVFPDGVPQLATGAIDVGSGGVVPALFNAITREAGLRIVATATEFGPNQRSTSFLVRKDLIDSGQVKEFADLKGLTIATPPGPNVFDIVVDKALQSANLTLTDVNIVKMGFPDMAAALATRSIDVGLVIDPFAVGVVAKGLAMRWKETSDVWPNAPSSLWVYSGNFIQNEPEVARRFTLGMLQGVRDYENAFGNNQGRSEIVTILINHTLVKDPALYDQMMMTKLSTSGAIDRAALQENIDWFTANGSIQQQPDLSWAADEQFLNWAQPQLAAGAPVAASGE